MKPAVSSLNPYAAAYIPLSKREGGDRTFASPKESSRNNDAVWYGGPQSMNQNQNQNQNQNHHRGNAALLSPKGFGLNNYAAHGSYGSSSQRVNEVPENEEVDMDLEYLQMAFPGVSYQSLADVYLAYSGDLEAAIDMLYQLEFESSERLPDTLDIGDVSESGMSPKSPWKLKNVAAGETGGSPNKP